MSEYYQLSKAYGIEVPAMLITLPVNLNGMARDMYNEVMALANPPSTWPPLLTNLLWRIFPGYATQIFVGISSLGNKSQESRSENLGAKLLERTLVKDKILKTPSSLHIIDDYAELVKKTVLIEPSVGANVTVMIYNEQRFPLFIENEKTKITHFHLIFYSINATWRLQKYDNEKFTW